MKRFALILMVAITALFGAIGPAGIAGAQYPPGQSSVIRVNVSSVRFNETFTVTISPCIAGETVIFRYRNQTVTTTCDPTTLSASATFTPRVNPSRRDAQSLGAQSAAEVSGPGVYDVCGDLTGSPVTVPPGNARPNTLCTQVEVLADAPATTVAPGANVPATVPGGGLPATGSSGLGTTATSAIVLISAGALLLIVSQIRRRRTAATPVTS